MLTGTPNRPPDPLNMFGPLTMLDACHVPLMLVGTPTGPLIILNTSCSTPTLIGTPRRLQSMLDTCSWTHC